MEKRVTLTLLTRKPSRERVVLTPSTRYFEKIFHNKILTTKQHNKKVISSFVIISIYIVRSVKYPLHFGEHL